MEGGENGSREATTTKKGGREEGDSFTSTKTLDQEGFCRGEEGMRSSQDGRSEKKENPGRTMRTTLGEGTRPKDLKSHCAQWEEKSKRRGNPVGANQQIDGHAPPPASVVPGGTTLGKIISTTQLVKHPLYVQKEE